MPAAAKPRVALSTTSNLSAHAEARHLDAMSTCVRAGALAGRARLMGTCVSRGRVQPFTPPHSTLAS